MANYNKDAIKIADEIDAKIVQILCQKKSFLVEAGAGAGKTHSLEKVVEWLQDNKSNEFKHNGKRIACITYTNVAVDVIKSRLPDNSFISPSTIHNFAWTAIKQFQETLIDILDENELLPAECEKEEIEHVKYTLGSKYYDENEKSVYLGHNDILKLFNMMLDNKKFRNILSKKYPIILIDEYQDSNKEIVNKLLSYFVSNNAGIQFGFFGDSWQTIYGTNGACGKINNDKLVVIKKEVNFRSTKVIVDMLNKLRPELPQQSALIENEGKVLVITTNNFQGERRTDRFFTGDLPKSVAKEYVRTIKGKFDKDIDDDKKLEVLMLTHRILADQQGYPALFEQLGDGLRDADDSILCYLKETLFPLLDCINKDDMIGICDILKISQYPIKTKNDKKKWRDLKVIFNGSEEKNILDFLSIFIDRRLLSFPEDINVIYSKMKANSSEAYQNSTYSQLKDVKISEFKKAVDFISPESQFSTDHGVKGEEYESVLFVIGRGWNLYQFDNWMPKATEQLNEHDTKSFERNRNLFYVCCSRPRRNLIFLITIKLEGAFKAYLENLVGAENIIEYADYISA